MAFFNNGQYKNRRFTTDGSDIAVLPADQKRRNIVFYNDATDADISIFIEFSGDGSEGNKIELLPRMMWEPTIPPTNSIVIAGLAGQGCMVYVIGDEDWSS